MKPPSIRSGVVPRGDSAFTLIELLAVMAIILVLAGLILNIAGNANYNSAKARAKTEIKAMETALESYKADNGAYPSDPTTTETLDAHNVSSYGDPNGTGAILYQKSSEFLYQALAGWVATTTAQGSGTTTTFTLGKKYMDFSPSQLHVDADHTSSVTSPSSTSPYMYVIDPFGFSYGYSTANAADTQTPKTKGYNPTFDLWCTGGYASGGKKIPTPASGSSPADAGATYSTFWITNW